MLVPAQLLVSGGTCMHAELWGQEGGCDGNTVTLRVDIILNLIPPL